MPEYDIRKTLVTGLNNPEAFKVAVIREPISTIISSYVHAEHFNKDHDGIFRFGAISYQVDRYKHMLKALEDNLHNLHAYPFEKLEFALFDIASNFIDVPENFVPEFPKNTDQHLATSKDSKFYQTILDELYNYKIFDSAIEVYERIISKLEC